MSNYDDEYEYAYENDDDDDDDDDDDSDSDDDSDGDDDDGNLRCLVISDLQRKPATPKPTSSFEAACRKHEKINHSMGVHHQGYLH